ncbi:MAG: STAS domain-containing protein [Leptospiraceae bacterium]|nr:STAS domain-containing protein [Leptospiraceae bacterium]
MEITVQKRGNARILKLKGRLDLEHVGRLGEEVTEARRETARFIILNMIDVTDLSSTGIGRIYNLMKECETEGIRVLISDPSAVVEYVLDLARMKDVFRIFPSDEQALSFAARLSGQDQ